VKIKSFEELQVWQQAHRLTLLVYELTRGFPREEQYGITSQLRRAASSVAANIAEGYGRRTTKELLRSLRVANGEVEETRYFALLSRDLKYIDGSQCTQATHLCESVSQLLSALARSLKKTNARVTSHKSRVTADSRRPQ
jgi:four helix bundle protein